MRCLFFIKSQRIAFGGQKYAFFEIGVTEVRIYRIENDESKIENEDY